MPDRLLPLFVLCCCLAPAPSFAGAPERAAVVLVREDGTVALRIAYPLTVSDDAARADLQQAAADGQWQVSAPELARTATALTVSCRIEEIAGGNELTVWPIVGALRRFDELVIAYVGPSRAGRGQWQNSYVAVAWEATTTGVTYTVGVRRRDFTDLADLQAVTHLEAPRPSPFLFALVIGLAIAASAATYFLARRAVAPATPEPAPSQEDVRR
jgi:hypothetical protein